MLKAPYKGPLEKFLNEKILERKRAKKRQWDNGIRRFGWCFGTARKVATCKTNSKDPMVKPRFSLVVAFGPLLLNPFW
jgi:hypothetical protein